MKIITGHQPVYLPWLGLFHKMSLADTFIFMDDVQYLEQDWNNRNRIKGPNGSFWLTVPVRKPSSTGKWLKDILIDSNGWQTSKKHWQKIHWRSLQTCYGNSSYWSSYAPFFESLYTRKAWKWLADINETILYALLDMLNFGIEIIRASSYGFKGAKSELVLDHCCRLKADLCVLGMQGRNYLDEDAFFRKGICVYYQDFQHPEYPQRFGDFQPYLSVVDLLFNCGPESMAILQSGNVNKQDLADSVCLLENPAVIKPAPVKEAS